MDNKIIDNVLRSIGFEFNRFQSSIVTERTAWDCPILRVRVAETFLENYVVTLCGEDFIASTAIDAAKIIAYWYRDLRDAGKFAVKGAQS